MERFRGWPRYRDHMASVPPDVYRAEEHTITGFLAALDDRYGGAPRWARSRRIDETDLRRLRERLLVPAA